MCHETRKFHLRDFFSELLQGDMYDTHFNSLSYQTLNVVNLSDRPFAYILASFGTIHFRFKYACIQTVVSLKSGIRVRNQAKNTFLLSLH